MHQGDIITFPLCLLVGFDWLQKLSGEVWGHLQSLVWDHPLISWES